MTRLTGIEDIERLYSSRGGLHYGEGVTQMQHALQTAALAQAVGAPPSLIVAALLHDIGHLMKKEEFIITAQIDDRHEAVGAQMLERLFPESVYRPVSLHVAAKRYLCFTEPQYWSQLSQASKLSLQLQGGPFNKSQATSFERAPYWREATQLRRFDDMGKQSTSSSRFFCDYMPLMRGLIIDAARN